MYRKIEAIVSKYVQLPAISEEQLLNEELQNYGLDSIKSISLVLDLEEEFSIEFPDELLNFDNLSTISKIITTIQKIQSQ